MRKKSEHHAADTLDDSVAKIEMFLAEVDQAVLGAQAATWAYEAALLAMYVAFERAMLDYLAVAINNDSSIISKASGIDFPKHMTYEVCEYLIATGGYFDFKGRDGLIKMLRGYVPDNHWLLTTVKDQRYKSTLERLFALRNYATHESLASKHKARDAVGQVRIGSAGSWFKRHNRALDMAAELHGLAAELRKAASY